MSTKGKRTFWVTTARTQLHVERVELLNKNGFDIIVTPGLAEIIHHSAEQRASCILIDTPDDHNAGVQSIQQLVTMPEMNGVRFILIATHSIPEAFQIASSENFRDIIPMDLSDENWLYRVQYATSTKPSLFDSSLCELSMNQLATVMIPGRLVWINDTHLRLECRGQLRVGSSIHITGAIARTFEVPSLSLTVESVHKDQLMFRFGQALICRWRIPSAQVENAASMIRRMGGTPLDRKFRAFIAVARPDIRKAIVNELPSDGFTLKIALQRSTVAQELKYFSPDVIFMDERLYSSFDEKALSALFHEIPGDVPLILYGAQVKPQNVRATLNTRPVFVESRLDRQHLHDAPHRYRIISHDEQHKDQFDHIRTLSSDHPWSTVEVRTPARLTSLNPAVGTISLPFSVGSFTLARLDAPILRKALGRDPYFKITDMVEKSSDFQVSQFKHHAHFYLADVTRREQVVISNMLIQMLNHYYQKEFAATATAMLTPQAQIKPFVATAATKSIPTQGNAAVKLPDDSISSPEDASEQPEIISDLPEQQLGSKIRAEILKPEIKLDLSFNFIKKLDSTVTKAILLFIVAAGIMFGIIRLAMNIDESFYKDHGRQYSDFFLRMSDPEFRKANPAPGLEKLDR